jgi:hypothetical protein
MAVSISGTTSVGLNTAGTTTSFSFVSDGSPLYLVIGFWESTSTTLNSVTFNGAGLTRIVQSVKSNDTDRAEIWRLLNPTATTANIILTFATTTASGNTIAFQTSGQSLITPEGTAASNAGVAQGTSTGNLSVDPSTGDLTITVIAGSGGLAITPGATGGGTVTELFDAASSGEETEIFTVTGAATAVNGSFGAQSWAIAAIPLKVGGAINNISSSGSQIQDATNVSNELQFYAPASDISMGLWTGVPTSANLYSNIDETTASATDYIQSDIYPASSVSEVKLSSATDPATGYNHVIQYQYLKPQAPSSSRIDLTVELRQGASTVIASWTHQDIGVITTATQFLTNAQADSITDYTDLRLRFTANCPT